MALVITMSRRYGTGASYIAKQLSEELDMPVYDKAAIAGKMEECNITSEREMIEKLAQEPCIILGRCASEILSDKSNVFNIFVCADKEDRISRIMKKDKVSYDEAKALLDENDHLRSEYYYSITGKVWGDVRNYHMILDTSVIGIENSCDVVLKYFRRLNII